MWSIRGCACGGVQRRSEYNRTFPDATRTVMILYAKEHAVELAIAQSLVRFRSGSIVYPSRCHAWRRGSYFAAEPELASSSSRANKTLSVQDNRDASNRRCYTDYSRWCGPKYGFCSPSLGQELYPRELARLSFPALRTVQEEVAKLKAARLILSRSNGYQRFYRANEKHPLSRANCDCAQRHRARETEASCPPESSSGASGE